MKIDLKKIYDIVIGGISPLDHEMADAFIESGKINGRELADKECDYISDNYGEWVYMKAVEQIY